jgi:membrane protein DedA with SNARE-associated domain
VTPFLLGAGGFSPLRFLVFNAVGAVLWAIVIGVLGYLFGQVFEWILGEVEHYEFLLFMALAGVGVIVWVWHWFRRRKPS